MDQSIGNEDVIRPLANLCNKNEHQKQLLKRNQLLGKSNLRVEHGPMSNIPSGIQGLRVQKQLFSGIELLNTFGAKVYRCPITPFFN